MIGDTIPVRLPKEWESNMEGWRPNNMAYDTEKTRFRSFAERYVIARASHWKPGEEDTDAWAAIQDAKRVYHQIALASDDVQERIAQSLAQHVQDGNATQQGVAPARDTAMDAMKKSLVYSGVPLTTKEQIARVLSKITP